jgi:hypothetical protein
MPPARLLVALSTLLALACGRTAVPSGEPQNAEAMSPTPTDGPASPPDARRRARRGVDRRRVT